MDHSGAARRAAPQAGSGSPSISVLLPVYNAASTLAACLASVQRQSERDWECVIVDDGSTDDGPRLAQRVAAGDRRLRVLRREHRGLVAALNHGLQVCRGRWVARMDADDLMHRDRLAAQRALLARRPDWVGLGCHVRLFPRRGLGPGIRAYERWLNAIDSAERVERERWIECPVAHPTLFVEREALLRLGYRDRGWPEDYDLLLRLMLDGGRVGVLPRRLHLWRDHARRLSRTAPVYTAERFTACKAAYLARSFLAAGERYALWGYGATGRTVRKALEPLGKRLAAVIELHPGRLGNRIHGAPVLAPSCLEEVRGWPLLVSVAGAGPRDRIRRFLARRGFREARDFVCTA